MKINMIEVNIPQREFERLQIGFLSEKPRDPVLVLLGLIRLRRARKSSRYAHRCLAYFSSVCGQVVAPQPCKFSALSSYITRQTKKK